MKRTRRAAISARPPSVIVDRAVEVQRQRVDREIAPARVAVRNRAPKRTVCVAPVGLDILAQCRHLDRGGFDEGVQSPCRASSPGGDDAKAGGARAFHKTPGGAVSSAKIEITSG